MTLYTIASREITLVCSYAGLFCTVLTGFAKGLDYRPGDKFKGTEYNHSWNAVYIDNNWYLVDSHWATRYLISEKNMPENLVRTPFSLPTNSVSLKLSPGVKACHNSITEIILKGVDY